jgi:hypothetical protein
MATLRIADRPLSKPIPLHKRPARTPPSTFLFLPIHLSNSPEPVRSLSPIPESGRNPEPPTTIGSVVTVVSEELRRRAIAPSGRRHAVRGLYSLARGPVSTICNHRRELDDDDCCNANPRARFPFETDKLHPDEAGPRVRPNWCHIPPPFWRRRRESVRGNWAGTTVSGKRHHPRNARTTRPGPYHGPPRPWPSCQVRSLGHGPAGTCRGGLRLGLR